MGTPKKARSTSIMLQTPDDLHRIAKLVAAKRGVPVAEIYITALRGYLLSGVEASSKEQGVALNLGAEVDRLVKLAHEIQAEGQPKT